MLVAPRVLAADRADAYSLRTFSEFSRWRDLAGDRRAWEIYRYLADNDTGLFHVHEFGEGAEALPELRHVRDPIKIINVYGYGYCGILGPVMAGVAEGTGLGPARTVVLPGWNHVAAECRYDDRWHYLDLDVRAAFRRAEGSLASLDEARREPTLWRNRGPLFFPKDELDSTRKVYEATGVDHYYGFHQAGHTLDYSLRTGERFKRWWQPQGGRWHVDRNHIAEPWFRELIGREPRGPKPLNPDFSRHRHGNGRFIYEPNLTSRSADFRNGVYDADNCTTSAEGLTVAHRGAGFAIFEVRTPYVIVPRVGDLDSQADDREAALVELDATGARLEVSLDNGLTWLTLEDDLRRPVDLTRHVAGRYGYLLKIALRGEPQQAVVRTLRLTTWVQVAPAALPALRRGRNELALRTGDHYGLESRVVEVQSQTSDPEAFGRIWLAAPADYDPKRPTSRVRGEVTCRIAAPPHTRIAWFTVDAAFQTHQGTAAPSTRNKMAYAVTEAGPFVGIYESEMPADVAHWHTHAAREVRLTEPSRELFLRFAGDPALNAFTVYAHVVDDVPPTRPQVTVIHEWRETGGLRRHAVDLPHDGSYRIDIAGEPENESLEFAVASSHR